MLLVLIKLAIVALILGIGMGASNADFAYLGRRPALLLRSLLAMYVAVPLATFGLVTLLPLSPAVRAAMLVLAVSAGAPLLPRKLAKLGNRAYVVSLVLISSLLAIVAVPVWVALFARYYHVETDVTPLATALVIAKAFLLPLLAGVALRALAPDLCRRFDNYVLGLAGIVLAAAGVALLILNWPILLHLRWPGVAALLVLMLIAVAIGHVLGGPRPADRTALAITCATRHIGIAVVVATRFRGPGTLVLLLVYIVATVVVSLLYLRWRIPMEGEVGTA